FEDRLRVRIDVPWEIRELRIPALILQPLVENAIKHGISESLTGGEVHISARFEQVAAAQSVPAAVLISVTDTGPGVREEVLEHRSMRGLGLSNVERRLQQYGAGMKPLVIQSARGKGTKVEIRVPLQTTATIPLAASAKF